VIKLGIFDWESRIKGLEGQVYGPNNLADRMNKLEEKYLKQQELLDRTLAVQEKTLVLVERLEAKTHTHATYNYKKAEIKEAIMKGGIKNADK
jgi:hypothetical protein